MGQYLTHDLILHLIIFQMINLMIIVSNFVVIHHARRHTSLNEFPFVSILVPARNEGVNIERCLLSLLVQDYPNFEVLVLDDQSTDQTLNILIELGVANPALKILVGKPSNGQFLGKNWACTQLAQQAQGEILMFTDADTVHHSHALRNIVSAMVGENADMVTGYPRQEVRTWGERLLVPLFSWAMYSFNPLVLAYQIRSPAFASAVGQMLVFRRNAYEKIGGHADLGLEIVDDLALARKTAIAGLRWRVVYVADLISCRMYHSGRAAFDGFAKNFFAVFNFRLLPFAFTIVWLGVMFWTPLIVGLLWLVGAAPHANGLLLGICLMLSVFVWWLPYRDLKIPIQLALLYPLTILVNIVVAIRSFQHSRSGRLIWKGRKIHRVRWKWL